MDDHTNPTSRYFADRPEYAADTQGCAVYGLLEEGCRPAVAALNVDRSPKEANKAAKKWAAARGLPWPVVRT